MTKANINNVKIGDKAYIEVEILDIRKEKSSNKIITNIWHFSENGLLNPTNPKSIQLYIKEEIPTLGEGVEMMVSQDKVNWNIRTVVGKTLKGTYICFNAFHSFWNYAKPIELTLEQQLANALKEIDELKKQLKDL